MYHLIALDIRSPRMGQQRYTAFHNSLREYVSLCFSGSRGFTHSFVHGLASCQLLLIYLFGCNRSLLQHVWPCDLQSSLRLMGFFFFFWLQHVGSFSCSMRNLLSCGMWALELQHMNSLIVTCGTYFPDQELNSGPWHWEHGVLASGPLWKSPTFIFVATSISLILTFLPLFYKNSCDYKAQSL